MVADLVRSIGDYVEGAGFSLFPIYTLIKTRKGALHATISHPIRKQILEQPTNPKLQCRVTVKDRRPTGRYWYRRRAAPYLIFLPKLEAEEVVKKHVRLVAEGSSKQSGSKWYRPLRQDSS